jgi:ufm1-conjugating enzyme 1
MYRGGKICLTIHFKPLWAKNRYATLIAPCAVPLHRRCVAGVLTVTAIPCSPHFGIAHAMCLGLAPWMAAEIPFMVEEGVIQPK